MNNGADEKRAEASFRVEVASRSEARSGAHSLPQCDNEKYLQTWPVSLGPRCPQQSSLRKWEGQSDPRCPQASLETSTQAPIVGESIPSRARL